MTSSQYIFLRHGKLVLPYRDHGDMPFQVLSDLGTFALNPPIDSDYAQKRIEQLRNDPRLKEISAIYTSPAVRCLDTAQTLARQLGISAAPQLESNLMEVAFDLEKMDQDGHVQTGLQKHGIAAVNTAVFEGMLSGSCEPISEVYKRVETMFAHLRPVSGTLVCITHDFIMRVIEIYIRRQGAPYIPVTLGELEATRRNAYLSGFSTDASLSNFLEI